MTIVMGDSNSSEKEDAKAHKRDMDASMNPLKSHYGIDIGLPAPLSKLVFVIIFLVTQLIRATIYIVVGLVAFFIAYAVSLGVYCPFIYSGDMLTCVETQYMSPLVLSPGILFAVSVLVILGVLDYKIDLRRYF